LDAAQFNTCLDGNKYTSAVSKDIAEGNQAGVSGTPAFFVNGRLASGALPFASFQELIEEALETQ
jgi:protein-disulfide isomerase